MCANVGVIIGPMLGGLTSDLAATYPNVFGGIAWLIQFPYAPPNILSAMFLSSAALLVFFGLEEVSLLSSHKFTPNHYRHTTYSAKKKTLVSPLDER
jgi:hypothetical protein